MFRVAAFFVLIFSLVSARAFADETVRIVGGMDLTVCKKDMGCSGDLLDLPGNIEIQLISIKPGVERGEYTLTRALHGHSFQGVIAISKYSDHDASLFYLMSATVSSVKEGDASFYQQMFLGNLVTEDLAQLPRINFFSSRAVETDAVTSVHPGISVGRTKTNSSER